MKPDFTFDRAWGADVVNGGGTGFEVCTVDNQCKTGESGTGLGGEVALPVSVAASPAGDVFVFEGNRFRVERFNADGGFLRAWGKDVEQPAGGTGLEICTDANTCKTGVTGTESGAFRSPNDIVAPASDSVAVDPTGTVYVADRENDRVQAFSSSGQFQRTWGTDVDPTNATPGYEVCTTTCTGGSEQPVGGSLVKPTGIAAGATGDVYTADQTGSRVQKFTCAASTVSFASATATVTEATGTLHLSVQRTGDTGCGASVHYATANGSAVAGSDYDVKSGTLTFAVDETSTTIDIPITPDTAHESDETFSVTLSAPVSPATIGAPATSTVTITDVAPGRRPIPRRPRSPAARPHAAATRSRRTRAPGRTARRRSSTPGCAVTRPAATARRSRARPARATSSGTTTPAPPCASGSSPPATRPARRRRSPLPPRSSPVATSARTHVSRPAPTARRAWLRRSASPRP